MQRNPEYLDNGSYCFGKNCGFNVLSGHSFTITSDSISLTSNVVY